MPDVQNRSTQNGREAKTVPPGLASLACGIACRPWERRHQRRVDGVGGELKEQDRKSSESRNCPNDQADRRKKNARPRRRRESVRQMGYLPRAKKKVRRCRE